MGNTYTNETYCLLYAFYFLETIVTNKINQVTDKLSNTGEKYIDVLCH